MSARQQITAATHGSGPGFPPSGEREGGSWIGGDAYTAPCVAVKTNTGAQVYYYLLRDYLGNITHQLDMSNNVVAEYNFDAWGRRRDKDTWSYTLSGEPDLLAGRGFTSHEWLPWFNLNNMNGRLGVYPDECNGIGNPVVGRLLSPNNFVQMPDNTQNFNRYSYALNNPLKFTDPNGESFLATLALVWAGNYVIGWLDNVINKHMSPKEAFRNTNFIMGVNFSPVDMSKQNNYGFSNPQVDAHNEPKEDQERTKKANEEVNEVRKTYGREWLESDSKGNSFNSFWNSDIVRQCTGDAVFISTGINLTFLGGGSDNAGIILPLRGPDAFSPHLINTASFRLGGQLGYDILTIGKVWYNGGISEAEMRTIEGLGNSFDINIGVYYGFGPGGGFFYSYHPNGDISWYGIYGSGGWGVGVSFGFDYTKTRRMASENY